MLFRSKAGAFDEIFVNRKVLYENIANIIQNSKTIYENKINNQTSLFSDDGQKVSYLISNNNTSLCATSEILSNEFTSVGFYLSDHPLRAYEDILEQHKVKTFKEFESTDDNQCLLAGTIMSIKEKKTSKGNLFAIVKFSDLSKTFELFLFSEILEKNKDKLKVGNSFLLTILRDKQNQDNRFRRISVRKVEKISDISKITYSNVHIEIDKPDSLEKLYQSLKEKGDSIIKISIYDTGKNYLFELKDKRKFNYETFKNLNKEHFIKKISI